MLFLDEPTIGLDVVAQHNIQKFLKHYQQDAQDHDSADQPLHEGRGRALPASGDHRPGRDHLRWLAGGIVDRFSGHKVLTLQFRRWSDAERPGPLRRGAGDSRAEGTVAGRRGKYFAGTFVRPGKQHASKTSASKTRRLEEVIADLFSHSAAESERGVTAEEMRNGDQASRERKRPESAK